MGFLSAAINTQSVYASDSATESASKNSGGIVASGQIQGTDGQVPSLQIVSYKVTQWLGMYRQSETRAGQHRRHTHTRHASLPTQANEVQGSNPPTRALCMQLAKIPHTHHTTPCATIAPGADKPARHPPQAQCLLRTDPAHTHLIASRRGNSPVPESMPRHWSCHGIMCAVGGDGMWPYIRRFRRTSCLCFNCQLLNSGNLVGASLYFLLQYVWRPRLRSVHRTRLRE